MGKNAQYEIQVKFSIDVDSKKQMSKEQKFRVTENNQHRAAFTVIVR